MKSNSYENVIFLVFLFFCVNPLQAQKVFEKNSNDIYEFVNLDGYVYSELASSRALMDGTYELDMTLLNDEISNKTLNKFFTEYFADIGSIKCFADLQYMYQALQSAPLGWAGKMIDSFGKPQSGILQGNLKWIGNYDECVKVYAPQSNESILMGDFRGKYCQLQVTLNISAEMSLPLTIGTCLPDSCKPSDFPSGLTNGSIFIKPSLSCRSNTRSFPPAAIGVIFLFSIFLLLAVLGSSLTAYEYFINLDSNDDAGSTNGDKSFPLSGEIKENNEEVSVPRKDRRKLHIWMQQAKPFLNCFCIFTNGEKLLNTAETEGQMLCLHGIRFLSLSWVVLCHVYSVSFGSVKNPKEAIVLVDNVLFQIVLNGFYSVDSFFLLSGFLLAYLFFQQSAKTNGKIPWIYFYVHRFFRLTPVYMLVLGFFTCVQHQLGSGPFWPDNNVDPVCRKNWWYNLLYINNLQSPEDMCMSWSWYLANDMQLFAISPLFLVTLWKWPKIGYAILAGFGAFTFAANFGITYHYNLIGGMGNIAEAGKNFQAFMGKWGEYYDKLYIKPYTRMGPYLVGIGLAYYLYKRKQRNDGRNRWEILCIGWFIATVVTLTCEFGLYNRDISKVEASFYNAFNRTLFAGGLAWVIYVCITGQGGAVNSILSFKLWLPLSRVTYCAYLVHPIVIGAVFGSRRDLPYFSHFSVVMIYIGVLMLAYIAAFVTSLLFESPIIRLDKFVRNMATRK